MKTGVLHYDVKLDKLSEFKAAFDEFLIALRREQPVQTAFLFINPENGKCFSVGFYETQEIAKAIPTSPATRAFLARIQKLLTSTPYREICDVTGDVNQIPLAA